MPSSSLVHFHGRRNGWAAASCICCDIASKSDLWIVPATVRSRDGVGMTGQSFLPVPETSSKAGQVLPMFRGRTFLRVFFPRKVQGRGVSFPNISWSKGKSDLGIVPSWGHNDARCNGWVAPSLNCLIYEQERPVGCTFLRHFPGQGRHDGRL